MSINHEKHPAYCPICDAKLVASGNPYDVNQLFALWEPIKFRKETIEEHKKQSEYTEQYQCPECKLTVFLPQIIGTSNFYLDLLKHESNYYYSTDKWDFNEALKDVKIGDSLVEIGCGPGNFLEKVKPFVFEAFGIEYNERALKIARDKGLNVIAVNDKDFKKKKGSFDLAYSFHVLEHVQSPIVFLQEMFAWVKPGGKIGISVPNMDGPVKYINPCVSNMPPHHATRWRYETFEALADRFGFHIERVAYEPLAVSNHYYYSHYGVNHWFPNNNLFNRTLRFVTLRVFNVFFRCLSALKLKTVPRFRGLSIYVLLSKQADK